MNPRMKTKSGNFMALLSVLALSLPIFAAPHAEVSLVSPQPQAKPKPSPEMERLHFYLGEWDYTESYPKSAAAPDGAKNTGLYTSKLGPGGNSLINTFHSQGPVGDFEGLLIITWDANEKAYKCYVFGGDFPGAIIETGQFEGDVLVFRAEIPMGGATMKMRNVTQLVAPGEIKTEQYVTVGTKPEKLLVTVDAKKK
jgi:hypothetical protein